MLTTSKRYAMLASHPAYIKQLREAGLTDLTFKQIIELSEREVDPAYVKALQGSFTDDR
ncbi:MAG: hypothetical protein H0W02_14475 [Ktedonobacteraceae bacterium]|nr:hypothetical protein [Ktedonobacteraceae bacterium]